MAKDEKSAVYEMLDGVNPMKLRDGETARLIREVIKGVAPKSGAEIKEVATILLHYWCAKRHIPSHRKILHDGICIDMVFPDARTLSTRPDDCLLLCILDGTDGSRLAEMERFKNVWIVSPRCMESDRRVFAVYGGGCEHFHDIIPELIAFVGKRRVNILAG